jgi:hypothetical protein
MFRIVAIKRHDEVIRFEVTALSASDVDNIYALYALTRSTTQRWFRLSEQIFRVDKWSVCRG